VADKPVQKQQKEQILAMRQYIADAYSFVRGAQFTKSSANVTFEQLIDEALDKIEGTNNVSSARPCKLDRIKAIKENLSSAVEQVKAAPPEAWVWNTDGDVADADKANTEE
jgi:hypothetical protein